MSFFANIFRFIFGRTSSLICRRRIRFMVVICTIVTLTITGLLFQQDKSAPSKDISTNLLWWNHVGKEHKSNDTYPQNVTATKNRVCKLPILNPFHKSVEKLIVRYSPLDCGKLHSTFEKNTLRVQADDVVAVTYRIISRPNDEDYSSSVSESSAVTNSRQNGRKNFEIKSGGQKLTDPQTFC